MKDVFISKREPLTFYVFRGLYRDLLVSVIKVAGGRISTSVSKETINVASYFSDIPSEIDHVVLGIDYIADCLKMKTAIFPRGYELFEDHEYADAPSIIAYLQNYFDGKTSRQSRTENVCQTLERETSTSPEVRRDVSPRHSMSEDYCWVRKVTPNMLPDDRSVLANASRKTGNVTDGSIDNTTTKSIRVKANTENSHDTDDEDTGRPTSVKSQVESKISRDSHKTKRSDGTVKKSQPIQTIDLTDSEIDSYTDSPPTSPSKGKDVTQRTSPQPCSHKMSHSYDQSAKTVVPQRATQRNDPQSSTQKTRQPFDHSTKAVGLSESDEEFMEKAKASYASEAPVSMAFRHPYSRQEKILILNYIKDHDHYDRVKGTSIWKTMERKNILNNGRSWQSMSEHFRRKILPNIHTFRSVLTEEELGKFKGIHQRACDNVNNLNVNEEKPQAQVAKKSATTTKSLFLQWAKSDCHRSDPTTSTPTSKENVPSTSTDRPGPSCASSSHKHTSSPCRLRHSNSESSKESPSLLDSARFNPHSIDTPSRSDTPSGFGRYLNELIE